jgi:ABC-type microcin C transport system duplicated ATPase subunit YejF
VQAIFQDPYSSLNPRMTVEEIVGEPLLVHGIEPDRIGRLQRVRELLSRVGLKGIEQHRIRCLPYLVSLKAMQGQRAGRHSPTATAPAKHEKAGRLGTPR